MQRALLLLALPVHSCATGQNCAPPCSSAPDAPAASDASRGFSQRHTGTGSAALALASGRRHQHKLHPQASFIKRGPPPKRARSAAAQKPPPKRAATAAVPKLPPKRARPAAYGTPAAPLVHWLWNVTGRAQDLPASVTRNHARLKALNPDVRFVLWDRPEKLDHLVKGHRIETVYRRLNPRLPAAQADILRLLLLQKYGGVYLDVKAGAPGPLSRVFTSNSSLYLSTRGSASCSVACKACCLLLNWAIAAPPRHPFLEAALEDIRRNLEKAMECNSSGPLTGKPAVLRLTGPGALTKAFGRFFGESCRQPLHMRDFEGRVRYDMTGGDYHTSLGTAHYDATVQANEFVVLSKDPCPATGSHQQRAAATPLQMWDEMRRGYQMKMLGWVTHCLSGKLDPAGRGGRGGRGAATRG